MSVAGEHRWHKLTHALAVMSVVSSVGCGQAPVPLGTDAGDAGICAWTRKPASIDGGGVDDSFRETSLSSVTSAGKAYAAVGFRDTASNGFETDALIRISCDGKSWLPTDAPAEAGWLNEVAFGNDTLVTIGMIDAVQSDAGMRHMVRKLGGQWQSFTRTGDERFWELTFGNGVFLARSKHGLVRSSDAVSWEALTTDVPNIDQTRLFFDGDRFITYSEDGFRTSQDGEAWSEPHQGQAFEHCSAFVSSAAGFIGFCGDSFVAPGSHLRTTHVYALTGPRGIDPADAQVTDQSDFGYTPSDAAISGNVLVAFDGIRLYTTTLPLGSDRWETPDMNLQGVGQLDDLMFGAGRFVAVGYGIATSADGRTWTQHELR
jgi:hypothetical protein